MEKSDKFPLIIFPHSHLGIFDLETVKGIFGSITICQPWYMEAPFHTPESDVFPFVQVQKPPESMKPDGDFLKLLSEYRLWMRQNQDKGYAIYLKATQDIVLSDNTPWELRRMIKQMGEDFSVSNEGNALKWHTILHLANEFEQNRLAAEDMLNQVRNQKSPLKDALEEGDLSKSIFGDFPPNDALSLTDDSHLRQIFEAWFGLFGDFVSEDSVFITFEKQVAEFAAALFEDKGVPYSEDDVKSAFIDSHLENNRFCQKRLPLFEVETDSQKDPVLEGLSGKIIISIKG